MGVPLGTSVPSRLIVSHLFCKGINNDNLFREQGWQNGESAHSHQCGPGLIPGPEGGLSLLLVLCSEEFFSRYSGFPLSLETNISKFQFDPGMHGHF